MFIEPTRESSEETSRCKKLEDGRWDNGRFSYGKCLKEHYSCFNGKLKNETCSDHEVFDYDTQACKEEYACPRTESSTNVVTNTPIANTSPDVKFGLGLASSVIYVLLGILYVCW